MTAARNFHWKQAIQALPLRHRNLENSHENEPEDDIDEHDGPRDTT